MAKTVMSKKKADFVEKEKTNPHPCSHRNSKGEYVKTVRALEECMGKCETCGFNPAVQKDRMENGKWDRNHVMTVGLYDSKQKLVDRKIFTGLYGLTIPKRTS